MPQEEAEKVLEEQRKKGARGEESYWLTLKEEAKTAKTTIQVYSSTKLLLNELKLVQKESYDEVIKRLIAKCDDLEQQVETLIEDLEQAEKVPVLEEEIKTLHETIVGNMLDENNYLKEIQELREKIKELERDKQ